MGVYGYIRISRDEDGSRDSIESQRNVIRVFAEESGLMIDDIIEDNNVSGYTYDRPGLNELNELIDEGKVDILLAKDLSRIGRHNAKTLLYIEHLEEKNVKLMLKSGYQDENLRGIETWYNEMYIRDLSRKTKEALRVKAKAGEVHITNFGYKKDPNNKVKCIIDEESAETVKIIFRLFIEGNGCTKIAKYLNGHKVTTPAIRKQELYGYGWKKEWTLKEVWTGGMVSRVLKNDAYIGTVRRGKTRRNKIRDKKIIEVPIEEQYVHKNMLPIIISKETFEAVQMIFQKRVTNGVKAKQKPIGKYTGILKCGKCGKNLVITNSTTKSRGKETFYICGTYNRYGSNYCTRHTIKIDDVDEIVFNEIERLYTQGLIRLDNIDNKIEKKHKNNANEKRVDRLKREVEMKKAEIKNYSKQLAKGLISEEIFKEMTDEANQDLIKLENILEEAININHIRKTEKARITKAIDVLKEIIERKELTNSDITMIIDKIVIHETFNKKKESKLDVEIMWNTPFIGIIDEEN
ncbi:recombinase family protein [Clostridium sp.]|uniref:recombinase family protein n=1 Tax=Clostridium sp. TaxID=1506 RepID=UPI002FDE74FE